MLLKKDLERQWIRKYRGVELVSGHNRTSPTRVLQEIGGAWLVLPLSTSLHPTLIWNASTIVECVYGNSIEDRLFAEVFFFFCIFAGDKIPWKIWEKCFNFREEGIFSYILCFDSFFFCFLARYNDSDCPEVFFFFFFIDDSFGYFLILVLDNAQHRESDGNMEYAILTL